jgi:CHAT domain-containing protein
MVELYQNLLGGAELSVALRDAQIWLMRLEKEAALKLLRQVVDVIDAKQRQYVLDWIERWGRSFAPQPFSKPYYWGAFQALGSPEAIFDGEKV